MNGRDGKEHGIEQAAWSNLGGGWYIECLCGWGTDADPCMEEVGRQFDQHIFVMKPIASNANAAGRAQNRRIEIKVTEPTEQVP